MRPPATSETRCTKSGTPHDRTLAVPGNVLADTSLLVSVCVGCGNRLGLRSRFGCACVRFCVWVVSARRGTQSWPRRTSALTQAANAWSRREVRTESTVASTVRRQGNRRNFTAAANIWHADDAGATGMPRVWCYGPTPHGVTMSRPVQHGPEIQSTLLTGPPHGIRVAVRGRAAPTVPALPVPGLAFLYTREKT
jgi:hypothetical protein